MCECGCAAESVASPPRALILRRRRQSHGGLSVECSRSRCARVCLSAQT